MPLVAHSNLPTFKRLQADGQEVVALDRAEQQDIRELHVGILNMMPDAALEATERQFMRRLGASSRIVQLYVHLFTVPGLERGAKAQAHIGQYYQSFDDIKAEGLDALIISGANVTQPDLTKEAFFPQMLEVFEWARTHVASVLCSCLASHVLWQHEYGILREPLPYKRWGVFRHHVVTRKHPLVSNINTRFDTPHSRFNNVGISGLQQAGASVLVTSEDCEVLLATSEDGLSVVYLQGHPEYDTLSLAKEYKREIGRFWRNERHDYPAMPVDYLSPAAEQLLTQYRQHVVEAKVAGSPQPDFPETALRPLVDNTWADTCKAIFANWLGLIYQTTHQDRCKHLMDGIDQIDPIGWRKQVEEGLG
ncbi:MAG: homoserine O-succinyltransferase [Gammaproteobacteria bacterium]